MTPTAMPQSTNGNISPDGDGRTATHHCTHLDYGHISFALLHLLPETKGAVASILTLIKGRGPSHTSSNWYRHFESVVGRTGKWYVNVKQ